MTAHEKRALAMSAQRDYTPGQAPEWILALSDGPYPSLVVFERLAGQGLVAWANGRWVLTGIGWQHLNKYRPRSRA